MRWAEPGWIALLILLPLPWLLRQRRRSIAWPSIPLLIPEKARLHVWVDVLLPWLEAGAMLGLILAISRPQTVAGTTRIASQGLAIVLVLDRSSSMKAADFLDKQTGASTRMDSAKLVTTEFIQRRAEDLIGLIAFANEPDLTCPPTLDHRFVIETLQNLRTAGSDNDGTNLGDALIWAVDTLQKVESKRKRIVLLSDGRNSPQVRKNHRPIDPVEASRLAAEFGIVVDTIAIGDAGGLIREAQPEIKLDIVSEAGGPDLELLAEISRNTDGVSFQAKDQAALSDAMRRIDELEKSPFHEQILTRYHEHFAPLVFGSLCLIAGVVCLRSTRARLLP